MMPKASADNVRDPTAFYLTITVIHSVIAVYISFLKSRSLI